MNFVDTHCHLSEPPLRNDVPAILARAGAAGVVKIVVPAFDQTSWEQVTTLAGYENVHPAYGLHPWVADQTLDLDRLQDYLTGKAAVAVGEIGLDFKIPHPGRARQKQVLEAQLQLARKLELPVILHCRSAFEELLQALSMYSPDLRGVVHAYSRGPELAMRFVDLGMYIAFGGALTRPQAKRARRTAQVLPLENIVLETDAPSIGLEGVAPEETEPQHVTSVATALAEIRNQSLHEIAEVTTANACQLFQL